MSKVPIEKGGGDQRLGLILLEVGRRKKNRR